MRATVSERLDRLSTPEPNSGCVLWLGSLDQTGYGHIKVVGHRAPRLAHRVAYEAAVGPIPDGLQIDHLCRNRSCINPRHLEAVTPRVNLLRSTNSAATLALQTHCKHGHPFDEANTYRTRRGERACRACHRVGALRRYHARREGGQP